MKPAKLREGLTKLRDALAKEPPAKAGKEE
jgi:hypothetical protein